MALALTRCQALLLVVAGGFKVNQLPASPFEGARHPSTTSASNSNDAPSNGPFGSRLHSMDTTNSNGGGLQSGNQGDRERDRDRPAAFRTSSSQKETDRSPKGRESPFEGLRQQQQQQVSSWHSGSDACTEMCMMSMLLLSLLFLVLMCASWDQILARVLGLHHQHTCLGRVSVSDSVLTICSFAA